jgi:N-acetylglucosaminyl-diphospho-decaprenol L-rhamnosyltransferase
VPVEIAFITVNYNTLEHVTQLANFFQRLDVPFTFSFTVVDNNSEDGSREFLQSRSEIHSLQAGENLGYGRAVNRGIAATSSKYVCVLNTDITLNRESLTALWRFMEQRPDSGVCAPRLVYPDGRNQGMVFRPSLFAHYANWYAKALAWFGKRQIRGATEPVPVDGVLGAFFVIRRSVIQPPLFDEDFFFFHEDTALAHSLKNRGIRCFVLPGATIIHTGGQSRSVAAVKFFYQSKYLYLSKFYSGVHARAVYFLDRFRIFRKCLVYWLISRVSHSERIRLKAIHYHTAWRTVRSPMTEIHHDHHPRP